MSAPSGTDRPVGLEYYHIFDRLSSQLTTEGASQIRRAKHRRILSGLHPEFYVLVACASLFLLLEMCYNGADLCSLKGSIW